MKRGRKSQADLTVVRLETNSRRPEQPGELTPAQAAVWRDCVRSLPADWFPAETHPLLIQYCRHTVTALRVSQLIQQAEQADDFDVIEYGRLLKMQDRETGALCTVATKLRLSQQASWTAKTAGTARKNERGGRKPWE